MKDTDMARLHDLQWMAVNDRDNPDFNEDEMNKLSEELRVERGDAPNPGESGTVGDVDGDGTPDAEAAAQLKEKQDALEEEAKEDLQREGKKGPRTSTTDRHVTGNRPGVQPAATTTRNVDGGVRKS